MHATAVTLALSLALAAFSTGCGRPAVSERVSAAAPAGDAALRERDEQSDGCTPLPGRMFGNRSEIGRGMP